MYELKSKPSSAYPAREEEQRKAQGQDVFCNGFCTSPYVMKLWVLCYGYCGHLDIKNTLSMQIDEAHCIWVIEVYCQAKQL